MPDLTLPPFRSNEQAMDGPANGVEVGATLGSPFGPSGGAVGARVGGAAGYISRIARDAVETICPF